MKGIDIINELPPEQRLTVQGDVSESYAVNWWENMVADAAPYVQAELYKEWRTLNDTAIINKLADKGDKEKFYTKSGKPIIGSIFSNPKAYNNYRSNKSIICKALDNGVPLLSSDGTARGKTEVQQDIKTATKQDKTEQSPYNKALAAASVISNNWDSLSKIEKLSVLSFVPEHPSK